MADRIAFNPIYSTDPAVQPTLADDLQWNFDLIRSLEEAILEEAIEALPATPSEIGIQEGHYEETFTASGSHIVAHGLGTLPDQIVPIHPQVTVYDSTGRRIGVLVDYVDQDTIKLSFSGTLTNATVCVDVGVLTV